MPQGQPAPQAEPPAPEPGHAEGAAPSDLVELGVLRGSYGVKGWVRVAPHDPEAAVLRAARRWWVKKGDTMRALDVLGVKRHGGGIVAKWAGCDTPEAAEAWRAGTVSVARGDFPAPPAGEFYWVDLVGAKVVNRLGVELGTVTGLRNNGAQDLLEVSDAQDGNQRAAILIPLVEGYVDAIDPAAGLIRVDWEADW